MRRIAIALALGLGLAVGCTQNFDSFTIGNGGANGDAALVDGAAGGGGADVSAGGTDGGTDAPSDAPSDAPRRTGLRAWHETLRDLVRAGNELHVRLRVAELFTVQHPARHAQLRLDGKMRDREL